MHTENLGIRKVAIYNIDHQNICFNLRDRKERLCSDNGNEDDYTKLSSVNISAQDQVQSARLNYSRATISIRGRL